MAQEPKKQQVGEGSDNYGQAAREMAKATKQVGKTIAKQATKQIAVASATAATSTVKAGVKAWKAVAGISSATAAGGPWGAIVSAAWSLRHTLYKILICVCMFVLVVIITIVSLPSMFFNTMFGGKSFYESYHKLSISINNTINDAYKTTFERIIDGLTGSVFDLTLSIANIVDNTVKDAKYDVCYILASYSVSMHQKGMSESNLLEKISSVSNEMFPVSYEERTMERTVLGTVGDIIIETVTYLVCTISPFNESVLLEAFNLDLEAEYSMGITNREYVEYMTESLRKTLAEEI